MSKQPESMETSASGTAYTAVAAAIPHATQLNPEPLLDFLQYLRRNPEAEGVFKALQNIDPELRYIYAQTVANSRSQATALDQMLPGPSEHDFLDRESLPSHALDTPERFSGGTSSLNKFFNQGNLYQPNSTQTTLATPSRSFPVYVCRGCPHGHCARRYSYPGAWKKHFEEQHLLAYWSMSDYLVCPHCTRNFHVNTDAFQKHLWAHMSEG